MFNLKDKPQLDDVQIIQEAHEVKIVNDDHSLWGLDFDEPAPREQSSKNRKAQAAANDKFRVRIYNVY